MDSLGEFGSIIVFVIFVVVAILRRIVEGRDVEQRNREGTDWTIEELPDETRRMLFGDSAPKTAQPKRGVESFGGPRKTVDEMRRQVAEQVRKRVEPPVAKPRQPEAARPPAPPPVPQQSAAPRPPAVQPEFKPAQSQQRTTAPPRPAPQPPRMVTPQSEGAMQRQTQPQPQRAKQAPRKQKQPVYAAASRNDEEGPHMPFPAAQHRRQQSQPKRRWLANKHEVRRAIILTEILGPPKALQ